MVFKNYYVLRCICNAAAMYIMYFGNSLTPTLCTAPLGMPSAAKSLFSIGYNFGIIACATIMCSAAFVMLRQCI